MKKEIICPKCKSKEVIKWGKRKTQNRGKVQRYRCKSCSETFILDPFYRMRNNPQKITCALDLFYRGLSTREIQEHFKAFYPHNSSWVSIYNWIRKFSLKITGFTDKLKVKTGSYVEVDELQFRRRKRHNKKGTEENWFIDAIDVKTRFMVSSAYVKHRSKEEIRRVLLNLKGKTDRVKIVTTDGLTAYENVVKKTFGYDNKLGKYTIEHKQVVASKGEGFNIWIERLHNTIRQRTKGFRGFHGSLESAYALMKGFEIYYNFIRKHESLKGKTPSDVAVPELEFTSSNRWLELIELSSNYKR